MITVAKLEMPGIIKHTNNLLDRFKGTKSDTKHRHFKLAVCTIMIMTHWKVCHSLN